MSAHLLLKTPAPSIAGAAATGILRRRCACGNDTTTGGACTRCADQHSAFLKGATMERTGVAVPTEVHDVLCSPGQPLDPATRAAFEPRFGQDLSHVRLHENAQAASSAQLVGALAYAAGHHVVLGSSGTGQSRRDRDLLLAHEIAHTLQQSSPNALPSSIEPEHSPAEIDADRVAQRVVGGDATGVRVGVGGAETLHRQTAARPPRVGTAFSHPTGAPSAFRRIEATFDGQDFEVKGDGRSILNTPGQSGRPVAVRAADARTCGGSTSDSYLNNPRYVGIRDYGPIPEGDFRFTATQFATFSASEQLQMIGGGHFRDPFGASIHGGDWGSGRVPLTPVRVLPGPCGSTRRRSGFFLHGGSLSGSSGCIDIGNAGIAALLPLLSGFRRSIPVHVHYTHAAPAVGRASRAIGGFVYPGGEGDPTIEDRLRGAWDQLVGE